MTGEEIVNGDPELRHLVDELRRICEALDARARTLGYPTSSEGFIRVVLDGAAAHDKKRLASAKAGPVVDLEQVRALSGQRTTKP